MTAHWGNRANNDVQVILPLENGYERHVKVTHEGIIEEIVVEGAIDDSAWVTHDDLLPAPEEAI